MKYEEIIEKIEAHAYDAPLPKADKYSLTYIFDENKSVRWNREEAVRRNKEYTEKMAEYRHSCAEKSKEFSADITAFVAAETGLTKEKAAKVAAKAYADKHSDGYRDVLSEAYELAGLLSEILSPDTTDNSIASRKYVALIGSFAVRDTQFCTTADNGPSSDDWDDYEGAEIYLGIFTGTGEEQVREDAASHAMTVPDNIRLIDVDSDA